MLHLLPASVAAAVTPGDDYVPDAYATDGFIHCTGDDALMLQVANRFYRDLGEPAVVWTIDETAVRSEVRWEPPMPENPPDYDGPLFPHIYGPLNTDAVVATRRLLRDTDGTYVGYA